MYYVQDKDERIPVRIYTLRKVDQSVARACVVRACHGSKLSLIIYIYIDIETLYVLYIQDEEERLPLRVRVNRARPARCSCWWRRWWNALPAHPSGGALREKHRKGVTEPNR